MNSPREKLQERRELIRRAVDDYRRRRSSGDPLDEAQFIAQNPTLMPELGIELAHSRRADWPAAAPTVAVDLTIPPLPPVSSSDEELPKSGSTLKRPEPVEGAPITIPGYTLVREIHRGGQGVVFEGVQTTSGQRVAIKILRQGPLASPQEQARFDREAQVLSALRQPNIVCVIDRGRTQEGAFFLVMEYVEGKSLDEWLDAFFRTHPEGPPPGDPSEILRLFMKIGEAVNAAHLRGVVHRDLKPSNIKVDDRGEPHILDFGLAHVFTGGLRELAGNQPVTITGQFLGSLPWASPEQAEGIPSKIDFRTDVYSLGVILYQMLTGQFPYEVVGNMRDVLDNIMRVEPSPPSMVIEAKRARMAQAQRRRRPRNARINPAIDAIVLKALSKRREHRYQTAGEMARDVGNYLAGRATIAGGAQATPAATWRTGSLIAASLLAVAGLSGFTVLQIERWWRDKPAELSGAGGENRPAASARPGDKSSPSGESPGAASPGATERPATGGGDPATISTPGKGTGPGGSPREGDPGKATSAGPLGAGSGDGGDSDPVARVTPGGSSSQPGAEKSPPGASGEPDPLVPPSPVGPSPGPVVVRPSVETPARDPVVLKSWRIGLATTAPNPSEKTLLRSIAWSPDGKVLAVAGQRGGFPALGLFDASCTSPVRWVRDNAPVADLRWSIRRKVLVGLGSGQIATVWTGKTSPLLELPASYNPKATATAAAWAPDGSKLVLGASDGLLTYYDFPSGRARHRLLVRGQNNRILGLDWSPDGRLLAVARAGDKQIEIVNESGGDEQPIPGPCENASAIAFAPNSTMLAVCGEGTPYVELWDARTGKLTSRLDARPWAYAVAWSPDGSQLAVACAPDARGDQPGSLCLFNIGAEGRLWITPQAVAPPPAAGFPLSWSPDGRMIACVAGDHKITAYDQGTGKPRVVLSSVGASPPQPVAIGPGGHFRGPKGVEKDLIYIATTSDGKEATLSAGEFFQKYGVQNNPDAVAPLAPPDRPASKQFSDRGNP